MQRQCDIVSLGPAHSSRFVFRACPLHSCRLVSRSRNRESVRNYAAATAVVIGRVIRKNARWHAAWTFTLTATRAAAAAAAASSRAGWAD